MKDWWQKEREVWGKVIVTELLRYHENIYQTRYIIFFENFNIFPPALRLDAALWRKLPLSCVGILD